MTPTPTPHHPTSSILHCYPLPIHHPFPPLKSLIIHFVRVLLLLVINTGCLKKMGNTTLLISSSIYAKRDINVCSGGDLCSPFFSNSSDTPCMKVGFDVKDFPRLMNEGRFPEGGRFHFLLSSWTLPLLAGNSLLVIQKAKLLNMNS